MPAKEKPISLSRPFIQGNLCWAQSGQLSQGKIAFETKNCPVVVYIHATDPSFQRNPYRPSFIQREAISAAIKPARAAESEVSKRQLAHLLLPARPGSTKSELGTHPSNDEEEDSGDNGELFDDSDKDIFAIYNNDGCGDDNSDGNRLRIFT